MPVKDYYKILELPPNAGDEAVKKSFRRLALRFHPDTNRGHRHENAWYREIQEAYEVLSDPAKKSKYLQERWLVKSKGIPFEDTFPLTPDYIELRFSTMARSVGRMDHFRMDHIGLQKQLLQLTSDEILDALQQYHDPKANEQIVQHLLFCMEPLEFSYLGVFKIPLQKIAARQPGLQMQIDKWFKKRRQEHWWDKKQGWIIGGITVILCLVIVLLTRH